MKTPDAIVPEIRRPVDTHLNFRTFLNEVEQMVSSNAESEPTAVETRQEEDSHVQTDGLSPIHSIPGPLATTESDLLTMFSDLPPLIPLREEDSDEERSPASLLRHVAIPDSTLLGPMDEAISAAADVAAAPLVNTTTATTVGPERSNASVGHPMEEHLIDLGEANYVKDEPADNAPTPGGLTTPSEAPASTSSSTSVPRLGPVNNNEWRELWPELTSMLKHLLQPSTSTGSTAAPAVVHEEVMPGAMVVEEPSNEDTREIGTAVEESPLVGEPLLCRPLGARSAERPWRIVVDAPFFSGGDSFTVRSSTLIDQETNNAVESTTQLPSPVSTVPQPLFATFLSDNNIPDGQMFPPGAEFVKSWKMVNPGASDWPESTELVFVAGDRMAPSGGVPRRVHVGAVKAGEEVEVIAGEMKVCLISVVRCAYLIIRSSGS